MNGRRGFVAVAAVVAAVAAGWFLWPEGHEGAIRRELRALTAEANERAGAGLGTVAKAARLGAYFTDDVVVDLGAGTAPITGRQTLIGMATKLQPPAGAVVVSVEDVAAQVRPGEVAADVALTVTFRRRDPNTREETLDARELALEMRKEGGGWRIARVTAVETLK